MERMSTRDMSGSHRQNGHSDESGSVMATDHAGPLGISSPNVPSRRANIGTAMAGIDRFKKSWISVMLLKGTIGLGQVIALITLLILASVLDSPLAPYKKQSVPSPACPRPQLYQAWMAVNICRLTVCWLVSCWMCMRYQRSRRNNVPSDDDEEGRPSSRGSIRRSGQISRSFPRSDTAPSLTFSATSASSATIDAMSNMSHDNPVYHTPQSVHTSVMGSTLSLDALATYAMVPKQPLRNARPTVVQVYDSEETINPQITHRETLQAARDLHAGIEQHDLEVPTTTGFAAWLNRYAPTISKSLGVISAILFILGNILIFYPNFTSQNTCYHAAPMLWWGVMTVVAIGWILFIQVFFVVAIVGIGGQAVLALLRKIGVITPPPEPEPARPALPPALTRSELQKLKLVVYVPEPTEHHSAISPASTDPNEIALSPIRPPLVVDTTRLAYPPIYLPPHKSTCAICQEQFDGPKEAKSIMLKADPLRLLGCGHVYHTECIDQWLLHGHGNCPFCNRSVRETMREQKNGEDLEVEEKITTRRKSLFGR